MRINDSWGIQRESMLSSHIYHLVWFSNLLGPFVSSIRNHLIESPKSISLCFQLAYCCPFWLTAYNDSLVSGISKSVFGGSDLFPRTVIFTAPPSHRKTRSLFSRAFSSSACPSAQPPSPAGALTERTRPALAGLFSSWSSEQSRAAPKHRAPGDPWGVQHRNTCERCPCTSVMIISSPLHSKLVIITIPWVRKLGLRHSVTCLRAHR